MAWHPVYKIKLIYPRFDTRYMRMYEKVRLAQLNNIPIGAAMFVIFLYKRL